MTLIDFLIPVVVLAACVLLGLAIRQRTLRGLAPTLDLRDEINKRNLEEVKREVDSLLADRTGWDIELASERVSGFDPLTNVFCSKYRYVGDSIGSIQIDTGKFRPSTHKGFLMTGDSDEGDQILLDEKNGQAIWLGPAEPLCDGLKFTSLYHLLLFELLSSLQGENA